IGPTDQNSVTNFLYSNGKTGDWILWYKDTTGKEGGIVGRELFLSKLGSGDDVVHTKVTDIENIAKFHEMAPLTKSEHRAFTENPESVQNEKIRKAIHARVGGSEMFHRDAKQAQQAAIQERGQPIIHIDPEHTTGLLITYSPDAKAIKE